MNKNEQNTTENTEKKTFRKVLTVAIIVNLVLVFVAIGAAVVVKDVTISVNGKSIGYKTTAKSVDKMLEGWGVSLDEGDVVSPGADAKLEDNMDVDIKLLEVREETVSEKTKFKTKKYDSSELVEGKTKVTKKGKKGEDKVTYEVTYLGGEEQSRKEIARETVRKPVTQEVAVGTAVEFDGELYSRKLVVQATAYSGGGRTATGTRARVGEIAVDPRVIPLGSECYIEGFGKVRAEDTGGAVKGNIIDIYMSSQGAAIRWGRRTVTIYIK